LNFGDQHREIVEACMSGNRTAQRQLYQLYSKAMYNTCYRMVGNEADAEDILQNSFIDVFTKLNSFKFESTIGAWIKRIVINNSINFLKKRRINFEILDDKTIDISEENESPVDNSLTMAKVNEAMEQLSDGYRQVFSLYLLEGYDHKEIAGILGVSEATSKSQFSRAKAKIRTLLANESMMR